jgi:hypothetical protein
MNKLIIFLIPIYFFSACTPEEKRIPKDVMTVDTMKYVVWDMIQAGAYSSYLKDKDTAVKRLNTAYMAEVLKLHNISKEYFFKSFNFYQSHPVLNKELFDSVNAYAQRQRDQLYKKLR